MSKEDTQEAQELDFNSDDYNSFYYTNEKQIKKMDDAFILSKITAKYPDFRQERNENILKQVILVVLSDVKLIDEIGKKYDITPSELFKLIYRNYEFLFSKCFITKIHNTINNKVYAKKLAKGCRKRGIAFKSECESTAKESRVWYSCKR